MHVKERANLDFVGWFRSGIMQNHNKGRARIASGIMKLVGGTLFAMMLLCLGHDHVVNAQLVVTTVAEECPALGCSVGEYCSIVWRPLHPAVSMEVTPQLLRSGCVDSNGLKSSDRKCNWCWKLGVKKACLLNICSLGSS